MRLTFVSFDSLPLLDPARTGGIGGAEVRAVTFARGLQKLADHEIEFLVKSPGPVESHIGGFEIRRYQKPRLPAAVKLRRSIVTRLSQQPACDPFFQHLASDAVFCFGVRNDVGSIVRAANESGKKTVVFLTSDRNVVDAGRQGRRDRGIYGERGYLCRYALASAHRVIAQTPFQQQALRESFGIEATVIRNPVDLDSVVSEPHPDQPTVLWVGRADTFSKRADLCIELAKKCSKIQFKLIMNSHDSSVFSAICSSAPANVTIIDHVPFHQVETHFASCRLLVNTSSAEGFPNSFLQAAKYGKPIVSLSVDPGEMLSQFGCGACAEGDLALMAAKLARFHEDASLYARASSCAHDYVNRYHDSAARSSELAQLIHGLFQRASDCAA